MQKSETQDLVSSSNELNGFRNRTFYVFVGSYWYTTVFPTLCETNTTRQFLLSLYFDSFPKVGKLSSATNANGTGSFLPILRVHNVQRRRHYMSTKASFSTMVDSQSNTWNYPRAFLYRERERIKCSTWGAFLAKYCTYAPRTVILTRFNRSQCDRNYKHLMHAFSQAQKSVINTLWATSLGITSHYKHLISLL